MPRAKKPDWREEARAWFAAQEEAARVAAEAERLAAETRNERRARTRPSRAKPKRTRKPGYSLAHWPHYPVHGPLPATPNIGQCEACTETTFRFGCRSICPRCPQLDEGDEELLNLRLRGLTRQITTDPTPEGVAQAARERGDILLAMHEAGWKLDALARSLGSSENWLRDLIRRARERRDQLSGQP